MSLKDDTHGPLGGAAAPDDNLTPIFVIQVRQQSVKPLSPSGRALDEDDGLGAMPDWAQCILTLDAVSLQCVTVNDDPLSFSSSQSSLSGMGAPAIPIVATGTVPLNKVRGRFWLVIHHSRAGREMHISFERHHHLPDVAYYAARSNRATKHHGC